MTKKSEFLVAISTAVIVALLGLAMIFLSWSLYREQGILLSARLGTSGRIVGFGRVRAPQENQFREHFPVPIVRFKIESGEEVEFLETVAERFWTDRRTGDTVSVIYDPANPERARIDEYAEIWFAPAMLFLVGFGAAVIPPPTVWRHYRP